MAAIKSWDDDYNLPDFKRGALRTQRDPDVRTGLFDGLYAEQRITTDIPAYWDVSIICPNNQANGFVNFIEEHASSNPLWFRKKINTEFGLNEYVVRIVSGIPAGRQIRGGDFSYSFTVECREFFDYTRKLKSMNEFAGKEIALPLSNGWYKTAVQTPLNVNVAASSDEYQTSSIYMYGADKEMYRSRDGGNTFSFIYENPSTATFAQNAPVGCSGDGLSVYCSAGSYFPSVIEGDPPQTDTLSIVKSTNGGDTFVDITDGILQQNPEFAGTISRIEVNDSGSVVFMYGTVKYIVSSDGGLSWLMFDRLEHPENPGSTILANTSTISKDGRFIIIGFRDGYSAISRNFGLSFDMLPRHLGFRDEFNISADDISITSLAYSSGGGIVYALFSETTVAISRNNGQDWRLASNPRDLLGLDEFVRGATVQSSIAVTNDGATILVAIAGQTGAGSKHVFASDDHGQTFNVVSDLTSSNADYDNAGSNKAIVRKNSGWIIFTDTQEWMYDD